MEKYRLICTAAFFCMAAVSLSSCKGGKENKQEEVGKNHEWLEVDQVAFIKNCETTATEYAGAKAGEYCQCILDLVIEKHPNPDDAHDLEQHEWIELVVASDCHEDYKVAAADTIWNETVVETFNRECLNSAREVYETEEEAKTFCDCALTETKKIIPNPHYAIHLTEDEFDRITSGCSNN